MSAVPVLVSNHGMAQCAEFFCIVYGGISSPISIIGAAFGFLAACFVLAPCCGCRIRSRLVTVRCRHPPHHVHAFIPDMPCPHPRAHAPTSLLRASSSTRLRHPLLLPRCSSTPWFGQHVVMYRLHTPVYVLCCAVLCCAVGAKSSNPLTVSVHPNHPLRHTRV